MQESGLPADIFVTTDWSNLNTERHYVISAGIYDSKEEAEKMLSRAKKFKSDAYIKYSGEWIGE
ncbi:MAG: SPOR domain-containing protein [Lachnospiraceae bacterium]|nr:SPOR domain-containing protein [Lachnospiraceae bacterium]